MVFLLLAALFEFSSLPEQILKNFPTLDQMHVLEIGNGDLEKSLSSKCKSFTLNKDQDQIHDLVVSSTLDTLSYCEYPQGCVVVHQISPIESLHTLRQMQKNGKVIVGPESQLVIWRERIDNGLNAPAQPMNRLAFEYSGGRLGDCLLAYLHCKWVSLKTGIPIRFKPFYQADKFALFHLETTQTPFRTRKITLPSPQYLIRGVEKITYLIPYFPDDLQEYHTYKHHFGGAYFYLDWQDPRFKEEIRTCLSPTIHLTPIQKPLGRKSVAIHIRTGGLYEPYEVGQHYYPLKFPPFEFYVDSLAKVTKLYKDEPLYVYIFTDDVRPKQLIERLEAHFQGYNIIFDCCQLNGVVDDFFALSTFECIIRGMSNFSLVSGFYGDPELIIAPTRSEIVHGKTTITETTFFYHFGTL